MDKYAVEHGMFGIPSQVPVALGGTVSILIAFRMNTSYTRWWEARQLWGMIVSASRSLVSMYAAHGSGSENVKAMHQVATLCTALGVAVKQHLRKETVDKHLHARGPKESCKIPRVSAVKSWRDGWARKDVWSVCVWGKGWWPIQHALL